MITNILLSVCPILQAVRGVQRGEEAEGSRAKAPDTSGRHAEGFGLVGQELGDHKEGLNTKEDLQFERQFTFTHHFFTVNHIIIFNYLLLLLFISNQNNICFGC